MNNDLQLWNPHLFVLLLGKRTSPLLRRLGDELFDKILAACKEGGWQKRVPSAPWTRRDGPEAWLQRYSCTLLLRTSKHCNHHLIPLSPNPTRPNDIWRAAYTPKKLAFEVRCSECLSPVLASGTVPWYGCVMFATGIAPDGYRIYAKVHFGRTSSSSIAALPIRAHIGTVIVQKRDSKRAPYMVEWRPFQERLFFTKHIQDDEWMLAVSHQAFSLFLRWA